MGFVQKVTLISICLMLAMTDEFLSSNTEWDVNYYG